MTSKGRRLTYLIIPLGLVVLVVAVYAFRGPIREQWYLWELESEDEEEQEFAAEKLGEMGSVRAVPILVQILRDFRQTETERPNQAILLGEKLILLEMTEEYFDDFWQAKAITQIGSRGLPHLIDSIKDDAWLYSGNLTMDTGLRKAVERIGSEAIPHLLQALNDKNPNTRRLALLTLSRLRQKPEFAKQALINMLKDNHHRIRLLAAWSMGEIDPEEAIPALQRMLNDPHEWVRLTVADALKKIQGE